MNQIKKIAEEILDKKNIDDYNKNIFRIADQKLSKLKQNLDINKQSKDKLKAASNVAIIVRYLRNIEQGIIS